jgi:hypothetical protein
LAANAIETISLGFVGMQRALLSASIRVADSRDALRALREHGGKVRRFFGFCFLVLVFAATTHAATITFITPPGSTTIGGPVSASATVTTSANQIVITLRNLQANPTDVAQVITDFDMLLSNPNVTTGSLVSQTGQQINIAGNGTVSIQPGDPTHWQLNSASPPAGFLQIATLGGGAPFDGIIGPPGAGGVYMAANGSIAGNAPHNPFISQTGTFTLNVAGVTSATTVTSAIFSFGTSAGENLVPGVPGPNPVPEPGTVTLLALGLLFLAVVARFRKGAAPAVK